MAGTTAIVFLTDSAIFMEAVVELVYWRRSLSLDMTCALDWVFVD